MSAFGGPGHLLRRFVGSLRARFPGPADQHLAARILSPSEADLFWAQSVPDLAHALAVTRAVLDEDPDRDDLARAALLHDVGKSAARLGAVGRSIATVLAALRIPPPGRMGAYLQHPEIGARLLDAAGITGLPVLFARHHRQPQAPPGVDAETWSILRRADHGA